MSDDYLTLGAILDEHGPLTAKWLSAATGRSIAQVYRYLSGEATIPTHLWRVVYEKTRDGRIPDLFVGQAPVAMVDLTDEDLYGHLDAPTLKALVAMRKEQIAVEEDALNILSDGVVSKKDAGYIQRYRQHHSRMIATSIKLYRSILDTYERSR